MKEIFINAGGYPPLNHHKTIMKPHYPFNGVLEGYYPLHIYFFIGVRDG